MAYCTSCGHCLRDGAKFCDECGKSTSSTQTETQNHNRVIYDGTIHKCPSCGEILESFTAICPCCGHEIRDRRNSVAVRDFANRLSEAATVHEEVSIIKNFPIPNTKEDIWEFIILASANVEKDMTEELYAAWIAKIDQAKQKAQLVFNSAELNRFEDFVLLTEKKLTSFSKKRSIKTIFSEIVSNLPKYILLFAWFVSIFVLIPLFRADLPISSMTTNQFWLLLDFCLAIVILPYCCRVESAMPKVVVALGYGLMFIVLVPLCRSSLDGVEYNFFGFALFVAVISSVIAFVRIGRNSKKDGKSLPIKKEDFIVSAILLCVCLVVYGISNVYASVTAERENQEKQIAIDQQQSVRYEFPETGLSQYLPPLPSEYGKIETDNDNRFQITLFKVDVSQFNSFAQSCKDNGFSISTTKSDSVFYAYHEEQYKLSIFYYEEEQRLELILDAPLPMSEISWPRTELVNLLPKPSSMTGNIRWNNSEYFGTYIADVTEVQYNDYVDKCMENGFNIDYSRGEKRFHAYNKKGYYVVVEKHLFDEMYVSIRTPEAE